MVILLPPPPQMHLLPHKYILKYKINQIPVFFFFFWRVSYTTQAGLKLLDSLASPSQVLELQRCSITLRLEILILNIISSGRNKWINLLILTFTCWVHWVCSPSMATHSRHTREATNVKLAAAIQPGRLRSKKGARISLGTSPCCLPPREAKAPRNSERVSYLCTRNS